jgi:hypothetical protein
MRILLLLLVLSGCATEQEIAQQREEYAYRVIATFGPKCAAAGFIPKSQDWEKCVVALHNTAVRQGNAAAYGDAYREMGRGFGAGGTTTNCTPDGFGGMRCQSY